MGKAYVVLVGRQESASKLQADKWAADSLIPRPTNKVIMPGSVLMPIFGGGISLSYIPRSHAWTYRMAKNKALQPTRDEVGSAEVATIGKRQFVIFAQHLIHGGQAYNEPNARLHFYAHVPGIKPLSNATMSPFLAFGEPGRIFYREESKSPERIDCPWGNPC